MIEHGEFLFAIIGVLVIVAAIVGGKVKLGPIVIPELGTGRRVAMALFGSALVIAGVWLHERHPLEPAPEVGVPEPAPDPRSLALPIALPSRMSTAEFYAVLYL